MNLKHLKKVLFFLTILSFPELGVAQDIFFTKTGSVTFFSSAPLEDIEAKTQKAVSFLNLKTGEVQFKIPMTSFQFKKSLMQEHFNENYVESDKFPYATLKGKIINISTFAHAQNKSQLFDFEGKITIHGVTKKLKTTCSLIPHNENIIGKSKFQIRVADHDIKIPKLVFQNIAEVVDVTVDVEYLRYQK